MTNINHKYLESNREPRGKLTWGQKVQQYNLKKQRKKEGWAQQQVESAGSLVPKSELDLADVDIVEREEVQSSSSEAAEDRFDMDEDSNLDMSSEGAGS